MKIKELQLFNFRKLINNSFVFKDGINIVYGSNGAGKTTLLEAIGTLSESRSFRTRIEEELISYQEGIAIVIAKIFANNLTHNIKIDFTKFGRVIKLDNNIISKISNFLGIFIAVIFTPNDVSIFADTPKTRRRFIDIELSKISPVNLFASIKYHKILSEKSKYLKGNELNRAYLEVLNLQLARISAELIKYRKKFLLNLEPYLNQMFNLISGKNSNLKFKYFSYITELDTEEQIYQKLNQMLDKEILKRSILLGIHQDDFDLIENDLSINSYYSQGEKRMVVLSIKLALAKLIEVSIGDKPTIILDDVLSELDMVKKNNLLRILLEYGQVFISTASLEELDIKNLEQCHLIEIKEN